MIITSMIEIAVFSGTPSATANWFMISFSSSSKTPSANAISTAHAKAVNFKSSESSAAETLAKAPGPSFFRILNNLSNNLSKAGPEKLSQSLHLRLQSPIPSHSDSAMLPSAPAIAKAIPAKASCCVNFVSSGVVWKILSNNPISKKINMFVY